MPPRAVGWAMGDNGPSWSHTTNLEAAPISASRAREFVVHHLAVHRLPHLADRVRLAASELATNALVHAQTAFSVTLSADDHNVMLTVRDDSASLPAPRASHPLAVSGRGLELVDMVSTDWGMDQEEAGSKAVWASFATA